MTSDPAEAGATLAAFRDHICRLAVRGHATPALVTGAVLTYAHRPITHCACQPDPELDYARMVVLNTLDGQKLVYRDEPEFNDWVRARFDWLMVNEYGWQPTQHPQEPPWN